MLRRGAGPGGALTVAAAGVVLACAVGTAALAEERAESLIVVHQIVPDPIDPDRFFAITSNMGILMSRDGGRRWSHANRGLRSLTHHALLAVMPQGFKQPMLLAGGWGGGVSVSSDRAATWTERNGDLANTAIDALAVDPVDASRWYAATSTTVFRSSDEGRRWEPFGQGLPTLSEAVGYKSLVIEPPPSGRIWLGTEGGLFRRDRGAANWVRDPELGRARVTAITRHPRSRRIYVGTVKQGVYVGNADGWRHVGDPGWFVSRIVAHPAETARVLLATRGAGVFASDDEGATWRPSSKGLSDPDVRSLAVHPKNPARLAAGTTSNGMFYSHDGGASWHAAKPVGRLTMSQIIAMLAPEAPRGEARPIPAAFAKCNRCHGWTHERLNGKHTYWRVPPNPRDWGPTVDRMAVRAGLSDPERGEITRFLTGYSRAAAP